MAGYNIRGFDEKLFLYISGKLHRTADGYADFAEPVSAEFFIIDSMNFDVNIDAAEQGIGDALLVFGDNGSCAGAGLLRISMIATRALGYTMVHKFIAQN